LELKTKKPKILIENLSKDQFISEIVNMVMLKIGKYSIREFFEDNFNDTNYYTYFIDMRRSNRLYFQLCKDILSYFNGSFNVDKEPKYTIIMEKKR